MEFETGRPNLEEFSSALLELARENSNVYAVTSDSRGSGKLNPFADAVPDRIVEVGIAEQNLVGVAAGLASTGKIVYAVSPASFLTARALEQIKNDVAYSDNPVNLIGISAGVSYGALGSTHHAIHDFAALRPIHNIDIVAPTDNFETREAIRAAARTAHPVYIRFGKRPMTHLHHSGTRFEIGKAIVLREGSDIAFVATGETVYHVFCAALELERNGFSCSVISMHTIKPLDTDTLLAVVGRSKAVIMVEEHSIYGGLGEACAASLMQAGVSIPFRIVGIPDEYTVTGSQVDMFKHYGISSQGLAQTARDLMSGA